MNVGQLKQILELLPDDTPIVITGVVIDSASIHEGKLVESSESVYTHFIQTPLTTHSQTVLRFSAHGHIL